tara:strand:- start:107 stop:604 length:498 start_codon:yes stop_codon:yes gene_type:complete
LNISDLFHLFVRWAHLISATAWVGGSIFWVLVLNPAVKHSEISFIKKLQSQLSTEFRGLVDACIFVLLATGAIMAFNRLTPGNIGYQYVLILGLKIVFVLGMFYMIRAKRHLNFISKSSLAEHHEKPQSKRLKTLLNGYNIVLVLGLLVYLLSDLLNLIYISTIS